MQLAPQWFAEILCASGNEFGEPIIEERKIRIGSWQQSDEANNADEPDPGMEWCDEDDLSVY